MTKKNKPTTPKPERTIKVSLQKAQFRSELAGANAAMRLAIERYIAYQKSNKVRMAYIDISRIAGISTTYMYALKAAEKDVSVQLLSQILLHMPDIKPYFFKAYDTIKKKYGYEGGLLDGVVNDPEREDLLKSEADTQQRVERLQVELSTAQDKIKEQVAIIKTKDELIEQLLNKLHV